MEVPPEKKQSKYWKIKEGDLKKDRFVHFLYINFVNWMNKQMNVAFIVNRCHGLEKIDNAFINGTVCLQREEMKTETVDKYEFRKWNMKL